MTNQHNSDDDALEKSLQHWIPNSDTPGLDQRLQHSMPGLHAAILPGETDSGMTDRYEKKYAALPFGAWVAAAVVIVGLAWWTVKNNFIGPDQGTSIARPEWPKDIPIWTVLSLLTNQDDEAVLLHVESGDVAVVRAGSSFKNATVQSIVGDTVILKPSGSPVATIRKGDHEAEYASYNKDWIYYIHDAAGRGVISTSDLARLGRLAEMGEASALLVLEEMATGPISESSRIATEILTGDAGGSVKQIRQLLQWADDERPAFRSQAIQTLSDLDSPLALRYFLTALSHHGDPLLHQVVVGATKQGHPLLLSSLQMIADDMAMDARLRTAALESIQSISNQK